MSNQNKYASATEFVEGGGLYDDVDIEVIKAETRIHTFPGGSQQFAVLAMTVKEVESGDIHEEVLLAGNADVFGADGQGFIPKDAAKPNLGKSSSVAVWNESCIEAGYPADQFASGTYAHFVGQKFHVLRRPVIDFKTKAVKKNAKGYDMSNLAVSKWLSGAGTGTPATGGNVQPLVDWITAKVKAMPAGIAQVQLFSQIVQENPAGIDIPSVGQYFTGDAWLRQNFNVNGGIVTAK